MSPRCFPIISVSINFSVAPQTAVTLDGNKLPKGSTNAGTIRVHSWNALVELSRKHKTALGASLSLPGGHGGRADSPLACRGPFLGPLEVSLQESDAASHLLVFLVRLLGNQTRLAQLVLQECDPVIFHIGAVFQSLANAFLAQTHTSC